MIILMDIGNTRIKWATWESSSLNIEGAFSTASNELHAQLSDAFNTLKTPERIVIANVAGEEVAAQLNQWTKAHWQKIPEYVRAQAQAYGVQNGYRDPNSLGVDRWLGMIAARSEFKTPLGIIHCGTCMTVDVLNEKGQHRGGYIVPGLLLTQSSVISRVASCVNVVIDEHPVSVGWGDDTKSAIAHGSVLMGIAFIEKIRRQLMAEFGNTFSLVITGGNAEYLLSKLTGDFYYRPYLVIEGLAKTIKQYPEHTA